MDNYLLIERGGWGMGGEENNYFFLFDFGYKRKKEVILLNTHIIY